MEESDTQLEKELSPNLVKDDGKSIDANEVQLSKAKLPMVFNDDNFEGGSCGGFKDIPRHSLTVTCRFIDSSELQPRNALLPISSIVDGRHIDISEMHPSKVRASIFFIDGGMLIDFNDIQKENALWPI